MRIEIAIKIPSTGGLQFIDADTDSYDVRDALDLLGVDVESLKTGGHAAKITIDRPPSPNRLDLGKHIFDMAVAMNKVAAMSYTAPLKGDDHDERLEAHRG